jgi:hypothetical protein
MDRPTLGNVIVDARFQSSSPIMHRFVSKVRTDPILHSLPFHCVFKFVFGLAAYGDDPQAAANYPLVRITNNRTGRGFYSRTHDDISRLLHLALSARLISMCRQPKSGPNETR